MRLSSPQKLIMMNSLVFQCPPKSVDHFVITGEKIGEGCFGSVYLGYDTLHNNQRVAVKVIERAKLTGNTADYFQNEVKALKKCDNDHIVRFIDIKKTTNNYYLIMEHCEGGDLNKYLKRRGRLAESEALDILFQLLRAFRSLVKFNFIHRDLKPENILFKDGKIKVGDFGLAIMLKNREMADTYAGSPLNMAPEILRHQRYDNKADIYSLGTVLYEMLFQTSPFISDNRISLIEQIKNGRFCNFNKRLISKSTAKLLKKMLQYDPKKRISWDELFSYQALLKTQQSQKLFSEYEFFMNKMKFIHMNTIPGLLYNFLRKSQNEAATRCSQKDRPVKFLDYDLSAQLFSCLTTQPVNCQ